MLIENKITADGREINNRMVFQPMEGCDCTPEGTPSELTKEKYRRFALSGAGTVWMEANAVCPEGRANPRQMMLTEKNLSDFERLTDEIKESAIKRFGFKPLLILQLTHSGRQSVSPVIAYRNPVYEKTRPLSDNAIASDDYLDSLADKYAFSTRLALKAGFDGVDVKCCHGYLASELLSAFTRKGRYGGSFENRTRLITDLVKAVSSEKGGMILCSRTGLYDGLSLPWGFGADEEGNPDWREPLALCAKLYDAGVKITDFTIGNPYFNPWLNRPYKRGPVNPPPVKADTALGYFKEISGLIKKNVPQLKVVMSGMTYYGKHCFEEAEKMLKDGICDFVGFGRMTLAYPEFYADYLRGAFDEKKICATCSKCTELMRAHCTSGCAVFNPYYRKLYKEAVCKKQR